MRSFESKMLTAAGVQPPNGYPDASDLRHEEDWDSINNHYEW